MADDEQCYPTLPRNKVVRYKPRAQYDYLTIHRIVNSVKMLHVSFATTDASDPFPAVLPMLGFMGSFSDPETSLSAPLDLYIHGYISSRLMRMGSNGNAEYDGVPLTVAASHLDGLVLALTPNHHSYNYRSAVLHGFANPVTDEAEKLWAMERITNCVVPDRWANSRVPPTKTEMTSTQILKVTIADASAKIRSGHPGDDRADLKNEEVRAKTWIGVIPTWTAYGDAVPGPENKVSKVPPHVANFIKKENQIGPKNSALAIQSAELQYDQ